MPRQVWDAIQRLREPLVILDGDQMMPLEELRKLDAQLCGPTDMFRQKSEDLGDRQP